MIHYDHDNNVQTPAERMTTTGEHPFWEVEADGFVGASDLERADRFMLRDGTQVPVERVQRIGMAPGTLVPVYNFAVANHHTYFAGKGGVWVHNTCNFIDEVVNHFARIIEKNDDAKYKGGLLNDLKVEKFHDPAGYVEAQNEAMKPMEGVVSGWGLTGRISTGATLFEHNPNVINGSRENDPDVLNRFRLQTGISLPEYWEPGKYESSIARAGNGKQPYFGSSQSGAPASWPRLNNEVRSTALSQLGGTYDTLHFERFSVGPTKGSFNHSEATAINRLVTKESECDEVLVTTGEAIAVCDDCANSDGSGLAITLHALRHHNKSIGEIERIKIWGTHNKRFSDVGIRGQTSNESPWVIEWDNNQVIEHTK